MGREQLAPRDGGNDMVRGEGTGPIPGGVGGPGYGGPVWESESEEELYERLGRGDGEAADGYGEGEYGELGPGIRDGLAAEDTVTLFRAVLARMSVQGFLRAWPGVTVEQLGDMNTGRLAPSEQLRHWLLGEAEAALEGGLVLELERYRPGAEECEAVPGLVPERLPAIALAPVEEADPAESSVLHAVLGPEIEPTAPAPLDGYVEQQERLRYAMWRARGRAIATQFRIDLPVEEHLAALAVVQQIELCLMMHFRDTVPEPGLEWDAYRFHREVYRRLTRLRWVQVKLAERRRGLRGLVKWMLGERQPSGKELFETMVGEADQEYEHMSASGRSVTDMMFDEFDSVLRDYMERRGAELGPV